MNTEGCNFRNNTFLNQELRTGLVTFRAISEYIIISSNNLIANISFPWCLEKIAENCPALPVV